MLRRIISFYFLYINILIAKGFESGSIVPVQVNKVYLRNEEQSFYTNNTAYHNQLNNKHYPSIKSCLQSTEKQLNSTNNKSQIDDQYQGDICTPQNFNQTNLLKSCRINVDKKQTTLKCHNKLFFILNKDIAERLREVKNSSNTSLFQNNKTDDYYKLRIFDFVSIPHRIMKVSQNEHQTCFVTQNYLQCVLMREDGNAKLKDPLFLMEDQVEILKQGKQKFKNQNHYTNNKSYNNANNGTAGNDKNFTTAQQDNKIDNMEQPKEQLRKRTIVGFSQFSYQNGKSVIVIMPNSYEDEDLNFITIHSEKHFYDFTQQQSVIKFEPKSINYNTTLNKVKDIHMTLNSIKGTVNVFLVTNNGVWIFEIQVDFIEQAQMKFVQKIETYIDLFSLSNNILIIFNQINKELHAYRMLEFSYDIQTIFIQQNITQQNDTFDNTFNEFSPKSSEKDEIQFSEYILRIFTNKKNSDTHYPNQYLIYLVHTQNLTQTIVSVNEFQNNQNYLTPLYSILEVNQKINVIYKVNQEDLIGMNLADKQAEYTKLKEIEKSGDIIIDFNLIKDDSSKNFLIYSTNNAVFVQPLCFPNTHLLESLDGSTITSYTYSGCEFCEVSTYASIINQIKCINISAPMKKEGEKNNQLNIFEVINYSDVCSNIQQKGPQCQLCSEYQSTFLSNEKNIQLTNEKTTYFNNQTVCSYSCKQQNLNQDNIQIKARFLNYQFGYQNMNDNLSNQPYVYIDNLYKNNDVPYHLTQEQQQLNYGFNQYKYQKRILIENNQKQMSENSQSDEQDGEDNEDIEQDDKQQQFTLSDYKQKQDNSQDHQKNKQEKGQVQKETQENQKESQDNKNKQTLKNMNTECVNKQQEQEYQNFCSKFTNCHTCSHHPFCVYNPTQRKCQRLNNFQYPQNNNIMELFIKNPQTPLDHRTLLEYQKYEICNIVKPQKTCAFSQNITRYRGEFQFYKNSKNKENKPVQKSDVVNGIEISIEDTDYPEYEQVDQFQICSWYLSSERTYADFDYEIKIETEEGFIQGKDELKTVIAICYDEIDSLLEGNMNQEVCKLSKMYVALNESMVKKVKFPGGKFRFIIQFQEQSFIDTSKIQITYIPVTNNDRQLIVVFSILIIISIFFLLIIILIFKNKILYFIRVKFNTLYFLDWEDNTELNNITIKQIIKKLERQKLLKFKTKSSYHIENYYQHTECTICLVELEQVDNLYSLVCQHIFHQHCFEEWVKVQFNPVTCPICKIPLNEGAFAQIEMQKNQIKNNNSNCNNNDPNTSNINQEGNIVLENPMTLNNTIQIAQQNYSYSQDPQIYEQDILIETEPIIH